MGKLGEGKVKERLGFFKERMEGGRAGLKTLRRTVSL